VRWLGGTVKRRINLGAVGDAVGILGIVQPRFAMSSSPKSGTAVELPVIARGNDQMPRPEDSEQPRRGSRFRVRLPIRVGALPVVKIIHTPELPVTAKQHNPARHVECLAHTVWPRWCSRCKKWPWWHRYPVKISVIAHPVFSGAGGRVSPVIDIRPDMPLMINHEPARCANKGPSLTKNR